MNKLVKLVLVGEEEVGLVRDMVRIERDITRDRINDYYERLEKEEMTDYRREALNQLIDEETRTVNLCDNLIKQLGA
jgi:hypothetical protein